MGGPRSPCKPHEEDYVSVEVYGDGAASPDAKLGQKTMKQSSGTVAQLHADNRKLRSQLDTLAKQAMQMVKSSAKTGGRNSDDASWFKLDEKADGWSVCIPRKGVIVSQCKERVQDGKRVWEVRFEEEVCPAQPRACLNRLRVQAPGPQSFLQHELAETDGQLDSLQKVLSESGQDAPGASPQQQTTAAITQIQAQLADLQSQLHAMQDRRAQVSSRDPRCSCSSNQW